ncbi:MAG: glycosyltransferase family 4 protein [Ilumatobacteraceae bacterium]|nr:glycosyltransferase family 4 protein [Ilumatobacteraceae bacterium]
MTDSRPVIVLCPHFEPDTAPTGTVMTRIVAELVELGHRVHVVTSLPWYREHALEPGWSGRLVRTETKEWGSITRVYPFPGSDKSNLLRRAIGFGAYSVLAGMAGLRAGGWLRRSAAVIAMSPPLTLGLTGWIVSRLRRAPLIFNIQDVFPDAAVETGAISNKWIIKAATWLERISYQVADVVTVLSDDLRDNVVAKLPAQGSDAGAQPKVRVIPNFVDTDSIQPANRLTPYREELRLGDGPIVLYAGNVGFSQSLEMVVAAARKLPSATFLINGDGAARESLEQLAVGVENVHFAGYLEPARLPELLATGDIHVVPLKKGLGRVSVPSKTYSIMAAARPVVAAIDAGTAVPQILAASDGGIAVAPDEQNGFVAALSELLQAPDRAASMGKRGREWVVREASPAAVGGAYHELIANLES